MARTRGGRQSLHPRPGARGLYLSSRRRYQKQWDGRRHFFAEGGCGGWEDRDRAKPLAEPKCLHPRRIALPILIQTIVRGRCPLFRIHAWIPLTLRRRTMDRLDLISSRPLHWSSTVAGRLCAGGKGGKRPATATRRGSDAIGLDIQRNESGFARFHVCHLPPKLAPDLGGERAKQRKKQKKTDLKHGGGRLRVDPLRPRRFLEKERPKTSSSDRTRPLHQAAAEEPDQGRRAGPSSASSPGFLRCTHARESPKGAHVSLATPSGTGLRSTWLLLRAQRPGRFREILEEGLACASHVETHSVLHSIEIVVVHLDNLGFDCLALHAGCGPHGSGRRAGRARRPARAVHQQH